MILQFIKMKILLLLKMELMFLDDIFKEQNGVMKKKF